MDNDINPRFKLIEREFNGKLSLLAAKYTSNNDNVKLDQTIGDIINETHSLSVHKLTFWNLGEVRINGIDLYKAIKIPKVDVLELTNTTILHIESGNGLNMIYYWMEGGRNGTLPVRDLIIREENKDVYSSCWTYIFYLADIIEPNSGYPNYRLRSVYIHMGHEVYSYPSFREDQLSTSSLIDKQAKVKLENFIDKNIRAYMKCQKACLTLMLIQKYRPTALSRQSKDITIRIGKLVWESRYTLIWR